MRHRIIITGLILPLLTGCATFKPLIDLITPSPEQTTSVQAEPAQPEPVALSLPLPASILSDEPREIQGEPRTQPVRPRSQVVRQRTVIRRMSIRASQPARVLEMPEFANARVNWRETPLP